MLAFNSILTAAGMIEFVPKGNTLLKNQTEVVGLRGIHPLRFTFPLLPNDQRTLQTIGLPCRS